MLVVLQFGALLLLVFTGRITAESYVYLALQFMFAATAIWGVWEMKKSRFHIFPEVKKGARLITAGPYQYIRHPMYAAIAGITLIALIDDFTLLKLIITVFLWIVLLVKTRFEEKLLQEHFPRYSAYKKKTGAWFPGL